MKKSITVELLAICLALPCHAAFYSSDFEDYTVGQSIASQSTLYWDTYSGAMVAVDPLNGQNQVLDITLADSTLWMAGYGTQITERYIAMEYDLYLSSDQSRTLTFAMTDNDTSDVVYVAFGRAPDQIHYVVAGSWFPQSYDFKPYTWMHTRWELDQVNNTFNLYIDGEKVLNGANCWHDPISTERAVFANYDMDTYTILVDNITVAAYNPYCGDGTHAWLTGDVSGPNGKPDCYVNFYDFAKIAQGWLKCTNPDDISCLPYE
jgi:hypothetical protein